MTDQRPLCIYHGNCADGFAAAWAVRRALPEAEFVAGVYQTDPPDTAGRHVILVDFSYKRPVLVEMAKRAQSVLILDHHKSAAEDLAGFEAVGRDWQDHCIRANQVFVETGGTLIAARFDMQHSGAALAWNFFNYHDSRPRLIDHIEDRDLWRFSLPYTREILAGLFSYPYDFDLWDELMRPCGLDDLRRDGVAIERKHFKDIDELCRVGTLRMVIGGHDVPVANLPYTMSSDAGHKLTKNEPFAACYWDSVEGRNFSLRSTDQGLDVSEIAKKYGGGGHRNAAGFRLQHGVAP